MAKTRASKKKVAGKARSRARAVPAASVPGNQGEALAYGAAFWQQGLESPRAHPERLGDESLEQSERLRRLAIITFVAKPNSDLFFHNLIRSARAREIYLQHMQEGGRLDDHHRVLGRYQPALDAIAAGDLERVRRIRALSPAEYRPGHEYEDDHSYAEILHELCEATPDEGKLATMLEALEKSLSGADPLRLDLCRALVARDQEDFGAALRTLLDQHGVQAKKDWEFGKMEDGEEGRVCVEALALLRLAERRGLATEAEYPYCPSLARVPMVAPFPGE